MARKLRIEFPGAIYHVINRGHRRVGLFADARTRDAFLHCLGEACTRSGWLLHAFVIMSNHFHLALETPRGNLIAGMQWLQSTFTNRYNRFRGEAGYGAIFQGRYKALPVEPGAALGMLCHYIHLNPVRAGIVSLKALAAWRWSSYRYLRVIAQRPPWLRIDAALTESGLLSDDSAGWDAYDRYLAWQAAEGPAGRTPAFVSMSRGWALGSEGFRAQLVREHQLEAAARAWEVAGAGEVRAIHCEQHVRACLRAVGKARVRPEEEPKRAPWKIAVAAWMKRETDASNRWLAARLALGSATRLSQLTAELARTPDSPVAEILRRLSERIAT